MDVHAPKEDTKREDATVRVDPSLSESEETVGSLLKRMWNLIKRDATAWMQKRRASSAKGRVGMTSAYINYLKRQNEDMLRVPIFRHPNYVTPIGWVEIDVAEVEDIGVPNIGLQMEYSQSSNNSPRIHSFSLIDRTKCVGNPAPPNIKPITVIKVNTDES